ncbi:alpha/beta fold hydrolase [Mycolicibacter acidiphilus]|uniref:alpha/beta fold hydrolase n=1 Tax=Mycolicibacter acidiphilus TaxID=2835306 RepID=UPI0027DCCB71|nr:alpha/beta hydrolase [Mycolicibacter acidiphilus]
MAAPREQLAGRTIELPGRGSTYVLDTGPVKGPRKAPTFLMLHSVACTGMLTWYPSLETMRRFGRVVIFDMRGHGAGIASPRLLLEDSADDAVALADALGIDTFIPVGFSMGSLVAQLAWRRHRHRVDALVLCAGAATFAEGLPMRIGTSLFAGVLEAFSPQAGAPAAPAEAGAEVPHPYLWAFGEFRATSPGAMLRTLAEIVRFDSRSWLAEIDVPTAVLIPARDKFISPRHQRWMAEQIPGAEVITVDAGHACCTLGHEAFTPGLHTAVESVLARANGRRRRRRATAS